MATDLQKREWFTANHPDLNVRGKGIRFQDFNEPPQYQFERLFRSQLFALNTEDRATFLTARAGHVVIALDADAKSGTSKGNAVTTEFTSVTQPHQLPTVEGGSSTEDDIINTISTFSGVALTIAPDATATRNRYIGVLSTAFKTWLTTIFNAIKTTTDAIIVSATALAVRVTATEGNVTALTTRVTGAEGNIVTLQGDVTTLQGDVTTIQTDITAIQVITNAVNSPEAWVAPVLASDVTNSGATNPAGYYIDASGIVRLKGLVSYTSGTPTPNIPLFTLPVGYRPAWDMTFTVPWYDNISFQGETHTTIVVKTTGVVEIKYYTATVIGTYDLSGISFRKA